MSHNSSGNGNGKREADNPYMITLTDPESPISEEYRNIKSMIVRLTQEDGFNNTLILTSALSGEGKSLSSANLAVALSHEYDYSVLLVDADLRKPSLHKYLNLESKLGLSDCLLDGIDIGEALISKGAKLSILPAGRSVTNPAELLSSGKMKELISEMKARYPDRYILIDTPPVLMFAETRSMSEEVDGIILVVREGIASIHAIQETMDILKRSKVLGILYNCVNIENINGHYNYYYKKYNDYTKYYKKA